MREWFKKLLSGADNCTPDIGRWSWLLGILSVIGVALVAVIQTGTISLREFAEALGIVSAAGGVSVAVKGKTEPPATTKEGT